MVRVAAARELLDRGWGKPAQAVEHTGQARVMVINLTHPKGYDPLALPEPGEETSDAVLDTTAIVEPPDAPHRNGGRGR